MLLHDAFPLAHDHNKFSATADHDGVAVADAVERVLDGAGRSHRLIEVRTSRWVRMEPELLRRDYDRHDDLLMVYDGSPRRPRPPGRVSELTLAERARAAEDGWRTGTPSLSPEACRQLGERISTVCVAAEATFLAVVGEDGTCMARTDLYVYGEVAQVEEVVTDEHYRGRGLATLLVSEATDRAQRVGADLIFLIADAEDWPKHLYSSLGYRASQILPTFNRDTSSTSTEQAAPAAT